MQLLNANKINIKYVYYLKSYSMCHDFYWYATFPPPLRLGLVSQNEFSKNIQSRENIIIHNCTLSCACKWRKLVCSVWPFHAFVRIFRHLVSLYYYRLVVSLANFSLPWAKRKGCSMLAMQVPSYSRNIWMKSQRPICLI